MVRFRLIDENFEKVPRVSWIIMPITMNGIVQAYFVVMESKEFINTIRKRIDRAMEIINFDADDYISRLKVIILLQYLDME